MVPGRFTLGHSAPPLRLVTLTMKSCTTLSMLLLASPAVAGGGQVSINELRIDQPSTDSDEYFELAGPAGTVLDGLTYLVIGDGSGGSGVLENVTALTGTIGASGYFVVAESSFGLGTADQTASLNFENSDNVTHLLVSGFSGANGDDLDIDDDGTLDSTPWATIESCIGLVESIDSGDHIYCAETVGPDGSFVPSHPFQCPALGGWVIGEHDPLDGDDTPGADNACSADGEFETYCVSFPNSVSFDGASIGWTGSGSISANDTVLTVNDCPDTWGLFFFGHAEDFQVPFGNGALCVGDIQDRWGVFKAAGNQQSRVLDFTGSGPEAGFLPGEVKYIQYWYRDPHQGAWNNTSNGLKFTVGA
jgi:hypothetical protein